MAKDLMGNQEKKGCKARGTTSHLPPSKVERIKMRRDAQNMPSGEAYAAAMRDVANLAELHGSI